MVVRAIDLGGSCTGEHGIGYGKAKFLAKEAGSSIKIMKSIKNLILLTTMNLSDFYSKSQIL